MRYAALLFGAGLMLGALAMYLVAGDDAGLATPSPGAGLERGAAAAERAVLRPPTIEFLELVAGSVDVAERAALHRLAADADRATLVSLTTQVAALPKIPSRALALELLLSRYGELDAPAAVALARELDVDAASIAPLFVSWARRDARAALDALADFDGAAARTVGIALLEVFGNDDLGIVRVLGAAPQIDSDRFRVDAAIAKAEAAPAAAFEDALLLPHSKIAPALAGIAAAWGKIDPHGALARVDDIDDVGQRNGFFANVLRQWAADDVDSMLAYLADLPPEKQDATLRAGALEALTWIDAEKALAAAGSLSGNLRDGLRRTALLSMAQDDALAALRHIETLPPGGDRDNLLYMIAQSYGRTDPAAAIAWAQTMPERLLLAVMMGVARTDPERAIDVMLALPPGAEQQQLTRSLVMSDALSSTQMAALADRLLMQPNRSSTLPMLTSAWARRSPEEALNWLLANRSRTAPRTIAQAGMNLARTNPTAAIGYLDRVPSELRPNWLSAVAEGYAQNDARAAAGWLTQYRGEPGYDAAIAAVAARTASHDVVAAARLFDSVDVAQAPDAPGSARTIAATWARTDAPAAASWAQRLDGDAGIGATGAVANQWVARDAAAARNWALSLPRDAARDAALVQVLGATAGTPAADAALIDEFSSATAQQRGLSEAVRIVAARDVEVARRLADQHVTDPGTRQAVERFIEQGANATNFSQPPPRVPATR